MYIYIHVGSFFPQDLHPEEIEEVAEEIVEVAGEVLVVEVGGGVDLVIVEVVLETGVGEVVGAVDLVIEEEEGVDVVDLETEVVDVEAEGEEVEVEGEVSLADSCIRRVERYMNGHIIVDLTKNY